MEIRSHLPTDCAAVLELVLSIQRDEFGMSITAEDQPDLVDVAGYYGRGDGHFWVATERGQIIGSVGLLDIGDGQAALRKMFVARRWRGPCCPASRTSGRPRPRRSRSARR